MVIFAAGKAKKTRIAQLREYFLNAASGEKNISRCILYLELIPK